VRIARHSTSDLVLLGSDIFRMITNLDGVGVDQSLGREIDRDDERAAQIDISDGNLGVMCISTKVRVTVYTLRRAT